MSLPSPCDNANYLRVTVPTPEHLYDYLDPGSAVWTPENLPDNVDPAVCTPEQLPDYLDQSQQYGHMNTYLSRPRVSSMDTSTRT